MKVIILLNDYYYLTVAYEEILQFCLLLISFYAAFPGKSVFYLSLTIN